MHCCMSHKFLFELQIYNKIFPKLCLVVIYFPPKNAPQKPVNFGLLKQAPALRAASPVHGVFRSLIPSVD